MRTAIGARPGLDDAPGSRALREAGRVDLDGRPQSCGFENRGAQLDGAAVDACVRLFREKEYRLPQ